MYALIDCNSFFASVEKVFHPGLHGKPVCVLSSNDGNIVALTPEAKALGIKRGAPYFQVRDIIEKNGVATFSGNMMLYAAMSRRITSIIRQSVDQVENYSIDESFCNLAGYEKYYDLEEFMRTLVEKIQLWTDVPTCVGVAPTKTLAKIGSRFAKKYSGYRSVCMIDSDVRRRRALELSSLQDVWGIGRRSLEKLQALGVRTPLEFADKDGRWVQRYFSKPGVQTWMELNGYPCIDTAEILQRQSITYSRSFGEMTESKDDLKASVASFAASCATTLRGQASAAGTVSVFLMSNRFRGDLEQYSNMSTVALPVPTSDTLELTDAALRAVDQIYRPGILYKKSGVILGNICSGAVQQVLFDPVARREERYELSHAIDVLNHKYGLKTVSLAVAGWGKAGWKVRSDHRTPDHLTDIDSLLTVHI